MEKLTCYDCDPVGCVSTAEAPWLQEWVANCESSVPASSPIWLSLVDPRGEQEPVSPLARADTRGEGWSAALEPLGE